MSEKGNLQANLENEKMTFFLLGWIVAVSTFFVLLEWNTKKNIALYKSKQESFSTICVEEYNELPALSEKEQINKSEFIEKILPQTICEDFHITEEPIDNDNQETVANIEMEVNQEDVYSKVEIMPQYPGGYTGLQYFLVTHIQYPEYMVKQVQGKIWCSFIVNTDGSVSDIYLEQGVCALLDEEVLRALTEMPHWKPGIINEKAVRTKVYLPICLL